MTRRTPYRRLKPMTRQPYRDHTQLEEVVTLNELGITVTRTQFAHTTRYRMTGAPELVTAQVEIVKRRYPPQGYGTWAAPPRFVAQGIVEIIVDRRNSCD